MNIYEIKLKSTEMSSSTIIATKMRCEDGFVCRRESDAWMQVKSDHKEKFACEWDLCNQQTSLCVYEMGEKKVRDKMK